MDRAIAPGDTTTTIVVGAFVVFLCHLFRADVDFVAEIRSALVGLPAGEEAACTVIWRPL